MDYSHRTWTPRHIQVREQYEKLVERSCSRLYLVTGADLPPAVQACQAIHAGLEFATAARQRQDLGNGLAGLVDSAVLTNARSYREQGSRLSVRLPARQVALIANGGMHDVRPRHA
jgi:hypothetical protein